MLEALEELMRELEETPDNERRQELFQKLAPVVELHRDALERMLRVVRESGHAELVDKMLEDPLLESLLRGYDLVVSDLEQSVARALEKARPFLRSHGGDVQLLDVHSGIARLALTGSCHGCASSMVTLKRGIETVLYDEVPALRGIEVEGLTGSLSPDRKWVPLVRTNELNEGEWIKVQLFEEELLVCTLDGRPFVFLNRCPAGGGGLETAEYHHLELSCPCHGLRFDLRSGRCEEDQSLQLRTFPATVDNSVVMVSP